MSKLLKIRERQTPQPLQAGAPLFALALREERQRETVAGDVILRHAVPTTVLDSDVGFGAHRTLGVRRLDRRKGHDLRRRAVALMDGSVAAFWGALRSFFVFGACYGRRLFERREDLIADAPDAAMARGPVEAVDDVELALGDDDSSKGGVEIAALRRFAHLAARWMRSGQRFMKVSEGA